VSWLYEHLDGLNGLRHYVQIIHTVTYLIPYSDRDDLEQEIIIAIMQVIERGKADESYLWGVAKKQVKRYWRKKGQEKKRLCPLHKDCSNDEEDSWEISIPDNKPDIDSRLDAIAVIATLPARLIEIGYKKLDGEKLSSTETKYCSHYKRKLGYSITRYLSDLDKKRIKHLYSKGLTVHTIAKTMGFSPTAIRKYLFEEGLRDTGEVPVSLRRITSNRVAELVA
jgi:RNA polymerase sigma factor (sigma-70 family)